MRWSIMEIFEYLKYGFVQRALIAGSFIALLCSLLGLLLVLRRLSLIGDGLAHVTFGSVALGLVFKASPLYVSLPVVMLSALGILKLTEKARIYGDAAIGVVSSFGIAAGVILASRAGGFNVDLFSYLFGNILAISNAELMLSVALSVIVLLLILVYYHDIFSITFDEELAKVSGISTGKINAVIVLLAAVTVVLSMNVVGILLISALLILPGVTALQLAKGFSNAMVLAGLTGVTSVITGIFVSLVMNLPTGATIVMVNLLFFIGAFALKNIPWKRRSTGGIMMILLFALLCGSCTDQGDRTDGKADAKRSATGPAYGDIMVEGSIGDASILIPILASDNTSHEIAGMVFNGLVKYDKDIKIVGDLAESWDVSRDGLVITFHLRKGVRWHDGHPFTAEDVLYTYRVTIDPKTPTPYAGDFLKVRKAEVLDPHTFRVTYDKPFAPALMSWGSAILPKHLLEGKDITKSPLGRHPVGTGPYRFKEWVTGQKIVLVANPDYFEGRPYIDGYIMRIIPDMATMFLELRANGVDRMSLTPLQYTRQTENNLFRKSFNKYRYLSFSYTFLGYNLKKPMFADKRVRQAIAYAVNKDEIIEGILLGLGKEATGPYKPGAWAYNSQVKRYPYDPAKARALLAEAGWKDTNGDGILEKNGEPFVFEIITNQGNEVRAKCAEIIQKRLAEVGIQVKIRILEWAAFVNDFINKRRFDATILAWTIPMDPDIYDVWHSSKSGPDELNFVSYKNREVDDLLEKGRGTFDQTQRKKCYDRIQEILAEEQPYLFLYVSDALPIIHARFRGIEPAPLGIGYNFIKWYVPREEQKLVMNP